MNRGFICYYKIIANSKSRGGSLQTASQLWTLKIKVTKEITSLMPSFRLLYQNDL